MPSFSPLHWINAPLRGIDQMPSFSFIRSCTTCGKNKWEKQKQGLNKSEKVQTGPNRSENIKKGSNTLKNMQKRPKTSTRIAKMLQTNRSFECVFSWFYCVLTILHRSEQVQMGPNRSENVRKHLKTFENNEKYYEKAEKITNFSRMFDFPIYFRHRRYFLDEG